MSDWQPGIDYPEAVHDRERRLAAALVRVLEWPLPGGTVETWALPTWLAELARDALEPDTDDA